MIAPLLGAVAALTRRWRDRPRARLAPPFARRPVFEALEQRLLLSADLLPITSSYTTAETGRAVAVLLAAPNAGDNGISQGGFARFVAGSDPARFTFSANAGQPVTVSIGESTVDSPALSLLAPGGSVIATASARADGTLLIDAVTAPSTGTYEVEVYGGGDETYLLGAITLGAVLEDEPNRGWNDIPPAAQPLALAPLAHASQPGEPTPEATRAAVIGAAFSGDDDWYSLFLDAGDELSVSGTARYSVPPRLELWRGAELLAIGADAGFASPFRSSVVSGFVAPEPGTYFVRVSAAPDGGGLYELVVTGNARQDGGDVPGVNRDLTPPDPSSVVRILGGGTSYAFTRPDVGPGERFDPGAGSGAPRVLLDGDGDEWDFGPAGEVISGGVSGAGADPYASAFTLSVASAPLGEPVPPPTPFPAPLGVLEGASGREDRFQGAHLDGIDVSRRVFVPADQSFVRYLETVRNDTAAVRTVVIRVEAAYAAGTRLVYDDGSFALGLEGDGAEGAPLTYQALPGGGLSFDGANARSAFEYQLDLAPGETRSVVHFAGQGETTAFAVLPSGRFGRISDAALAGLSLEDQRRVANAQLPWLPLDEFTFRANAGDIVRVTLEELPATAGSAQGSLSFLMVEPSGVRLGGFFAASGESLAAYEFLATETGVYTLQVDNTRFVSANANSEAVAWVLSVSGSSAGREAPRVVGTSVDPDLPLSGEVFITFDAPIRADTVDADDLVVNGVPADAAELVSATTVRFSFDDPAALGDPTAYAGIVAAGALADVAGTGNTEHRFGDAGPAPAPLRIVAGVLGDGTAFDANSIVHADDVLTLTFNGDFDASVLDAAGDDVVIVDRRTGAVVKQGAFIVQPGRSDLLRVLFTGLAEGSYDLRLRSATDAFRAANGGLLLDGEFSGSYPTGDGARGGDFVVSFNVDRVGSVAIDDALVALRPLGTGAAGGAVAGHFAGFLDTDAFTIDVEPGALLSLRVSSPLGFIPTGRLEVFTDTGTTPLASALNSFRDPLALAVVLDAGGRYRIEATGFTSATPFTLDAVVGGLLEPEAVLERGRNDERVAATDLGPGWRALGGGASRVAVSGALPNGVGDSDWYRFDAAPDARHTIALAGVPELTLDLFDASGVLLASGWAGGENASRVITPFASTAGGSFFVRVAGAAAGAQYGLAILREAVIETGGSAEQPLGAFGTAVGQIGGRAPGLLAPADRTQVAAPAALADALGRTWTVDAFGTPGGPSAWSGLNLLSGSVAGLGNWSPLQGTLFRQDGGRELALDARTYFVGGGRTFALSRETYVSPVEGFARFLDSVSNPGTAPLTLTLQYFTVPRTIGSNPTPRIVASASGDATFNGDAWIVRDDTSSGFGGNISANVFGGTGSAAGSVLPVTLSSSQFSQSHAYTITLAPGETRSILQFAVQEGSRLSAIDRAQRLAALQPVALAGLSDDQRASIVNFAVPADTDAYRFRARAGDVLTLLTSTPGDAPGAPVNALDPFVELYSPAGTLLARNDNGAADARNATVTVTAPVDGEYRLLVGGAGSGDYVVRLSGSSAAAPPAEVTGIVRVVDGQLPALAEGALLNRFPSAVRLDFSAPLDRSTVAAGDFLLNGQAVEGVTQLDSDTVELVLANAGDGEYRLELAGDGIRDLEGRSVAAFARGFRTDTTPPRVASVSIEAGTVVAPGDGFVEVRFDEAIVDPGFASFLGVSLGSTLVAGSYRVGTPTYDPATRTLRVPYTGLPEGNYVLRVEGAGAFRAVTDLAGNALDGQPSFPLPSGDGVLTTDAGDSFVLPFRVDAPARALAPAAALPSGGWIGEAAAEGIFNAAGDVDEFTLELASGQTLGLWLDSRGATRVSVRGPDGTLLGSAASAAGPDRATFALLQEIRIDAAGVYRVQAESVGTTDYFEIRAVVNAAWERESADGVRNDAAANAQALEWRPAGANVWRAAASGGYGLRDGDNEDFGRDQDLYRIALAAGDRLSVALAQVDEPERLAGFTLIDPTGAVAAVAIGGRGNAPLSLDAFEATMAGEWLLRVDIPSDGERYHLVALRNAQFSLERREGEAPQDITPTRVVLGALSGGDDAAVPTRSEPGLLDGAGREWFVDSQEGAFADAFNGPRLTIAGATLPAPPLVLENEGRELVSSATLQGIATVRKTFVPADGSFLRSLDLFTNNDTQAKTFTLRLQSFPDAGNRADVRASSTGATYRFSSASPVTLDGERWIVVDDRQPSTSTVPGAMVFAGVNAPLAGRAFLQGGAVAQEFTLTLAPGETRGVMVFIAQGRDAADTAARAERLSQLDAGALEGLTEAERAAIVNFAVAETRDADVYRIRVQGGDVLEITTETPLTGAGFPYNTLDPRLELVNADGALVAIDEDSAPDARNARLRYTVPADAGGVYLLRVTSDAGARYTGGQYTVRVGGATGSGDEPLRVLAAVPGPGQALNAQPPFVELSLSDAVAPDSVQPADLVVSGGVTATAVTLVDGRTLRFALAGPATGGRYDYTLGGGAVSNLEGNGNESFAGSYTIDRAGPRVVGTTPAVQAATSFSQVVFRFDEVLNDSRSPNAVITAPNGARINSTFETRGDTLTLRFPVQTALGRYTVTIGPGLTDLAGNAMDQNGDGVNGAAADTFTLNIDVVRVDFVVSAAESPAAFVWGTPFEVAWTVRNDGLQEALERTVDRVYLSEDAVLDGRDRVLAEVARPDGALAPGASYDRRLSLTLPIDTRAFDRGYTLFVVADGTGAQEELNEANNAVARPINGTLPPLPDLVVSRIDRPDEVVSGTQVAITWTLENAGTAPATGTWSDRIFLSEDDRQNANDVLFGEFSFTGTIAPGASVTRTQLITVPLGYAGNRWVIVATDPGIPGGILEQPNEANNVRVSDPMRVRRAPVPDLRIADVAAPEEGFSGQLAEISWTVTNAGDGDTNARQWRDVVVLSIDPVFDPSDFVYVLGIFDNGAALASGETYVNRQTVTLPRGIEGRFYLGVVTDYFNTVAELEGEADNVRLVAFPVTLTTPPDLRVTSVVPPATPFSGQTVPVTWTVTNAGDGRTDATAWNDRVFLSADDVLDPSDTLLPLGDARGPRDAPRSGALAPGEAYTVTRDVRLPVGVAGEFRFVVLTDARGEVFERTREDNNVLASAPVTVTLTPPPDLEATDLRVPQSVRAGAPFTVRFTVSNGGATATPPESPDWSDHVYLSRDDAIDAGDLRFSAVRSSGLAAEASYDVAIPVEIPDGESGPWYVLVRADGDRRVFELDRANNDAMAMVDVRFTPADLAVTALAAPGSAVAGRFLDVSWTVSNLGVATTVADAWTDALFLSTDADYDYGLDLPLGEFARNGTLAAGASYTRSERVFVPYEAAGELKLLVVADVSIDERFTREYEPATRANNVRAADLAVRQDLADLVVTRVDAPAAATAGDTLTIAYTVENRGIARTNVNTWYDRLVLSRDAVFDEGDIGVGIAYRANPLAPGERYTATAAIVLPASLAGGDYYAIAVADGAYNVVLEGAREDNNAAAGPRVQIAPFVPIVPDLTVQDIVLPDLAYAGTAPDIRWTQRNLGDPIAAGAWTDFVYLSLDAVLDTRTDLFVGLARGAPLDAGGSRRVAIDPGWSSIPPGTAGLYYVFVVADVYGNVPGEASESNNAVLAPGLLEVRLQPPANLVAGTISIPETGRPGAEAAITYTVTNNGANPAAGRWRDQLFLSADDTWDAGDLAFSTVDVERREPLLPGDRYTTTVRAPLARVPAGDYRVILRTDIRNQIPESTDADNVAASLDAIAVDIEALPLGGSVSGELPANGFAVYRLEVGAGEAVRLSVDSEADPDVKNEIVAAFGRLPDRGTFDVSSADTISPDPRVIIPTTRAGTYYITVFGNGAASAAFTLSSEVLPFSIQDVRARVVGNAGNATLRVEGARFDAATAFELVSPTGIVATPERVVLENASLALVTFDLDGAPLGAFDLRARGAGGAVVEAADAVEVVAGERNGSVLVQPRGFPRVRFGSIIPFNIDYENRTGNDIAAPVLILESRNGVPLGPSAGEVSVERPAHLLAAALEGPADTLRPGAVQTASALFQGVGGDGFVNDIRVRAVAADDATPVADWREIERALRPQGVADADWAAFWAATQPRIGPTWGDYVRFVQRLSAAVTEAGELPLRDVREMVRRVLGAELPFVPSLFLTGRLRDAADGTALAGLTVAAYGAAPDGSPLLLRTAVAGADGTFAFVGLQPGTVALALEGCSFDLDRDGVSDPSLPVFTLVAPADVDAGDLFVDPRPPARATRAEAPQLARTADGVAHLLYVEDGVPRYAFDAGDGWTDGGRVTDRKVLGLAVAALPELQGGTPGLVAAWQEGTGNDGEIWFALARPRAGGGYEWSSAARLTNDAVRDASPTVEVLGPGRFAVAFIKRDMNGRDDGDLYHRVVTVSGSGAAFPAAADPAPAAAPIVPESGQSQAIGVRKKIEWEVESLGLAFEAVGEIQGSVSQVDCTATAAVQGSIALQIEADSLRASIGGSGNLTGEYVADRASRSWKFDRATGGFQFNGDFDWRHGLARILGKLNPPAEFAYLQFVGAAERLGVEIEDGIVFGLGIGFGGLEWRSSDPFTFEGLGLPDSIAEAQLTARLGPYAQLEIENALEVRVEGTANVAVDLLPSVSLKSLTGVFRISGVIGTWLSFDEQFVLGGSVSTADLSLLDAAQDGIDLTFDPAAGLGSGSVYGVGAVEASVAGDLLQDADPVLVRRPDGTLMVVWAKAADPTAGVPGARLLSASFDGSGWSAPQAIAGAQGFINGTALVTDGAGRTIAVWSSADARAVDASTTFGEITSILADTDVYYAVFEGGAWSAATRVARTAGTDGSAALALDASGRAVVAWVERGAAGADLIRAATLTSSAAWTGAEVVAAGNGVGGLDLERFGSTLSLVWSEAADPAGIGAQLRTSSWNGTNWSLPAGLAPALPAATAAAGHAALSPEVAVVIFPPVPQDCLECTPAELARLQSIAAGSNGAVSVDGVSCTLVYQPVTVLPRDPNDIIGPEGFGEQRWIRADARHDYTIRFENAPDATAPASRVVIVQQLDPDLDPRSFRVTDFGFADTVVDLPGDRPFYAGRLDLRESRGILLDVTAAVDVATGEIRWTFETIDAATNLPPVDPFKGFLEPNDATGRGEGFVSYSVRAKRAAGTGTRVDAEATIVFDAEAPIVTPPIFNTLDARAPASSLSAEATADPARWILRWDGRDDEGSALDTFDVYMSVDGGAYAALLVDTPALETDFAGEAGRRYAFYSVARDNSRNVEAAPDVPDATFAVAGASSIAGLVFEDADGDGVRDADEAGIEGFTVWLDADDDGLIDAGEASTVASAGGYAFSGLGGGTYVVRIAAGDGFAPTAPPSGRYVAALASGEARAGLDFGVAAFGTLAGVKFEDADGDGMRDAGEPGLAGWTIFLDANENGVLDGGERSRVTDATGAYAFTGLLPGRYVVAEVQQAGWAQTAPAPRASAGGAVALGTTAAGIALVLEGCACGVSWSPDAGAGSVTAAAGTALVDLGAQSMVNALEVTGIASARASGAFGALDGRGVRTVVIDTGIDLDHPFFGPDADGNGVADRIVFAWDFADGDADASDRNGHGSHVSSLIASADVRYPGVAPAGELIVLKVFGDAGRGSFADLERALQWVVANGAAYDVGVVNLSLGDGGAWQQQLSRYGLGDEFAALAAMDVITVSAAGNGYYPANALGVAYPAADPAVIAVGATWTGDFGGPWTVAGGATDYDTGSDRIAAFSQRDPDALDVFAPGARFNGANATGAVRTMQGTSQAAAFVSGAAALAQQYAKDALGRQLTTAEFAALLASTSDRIVDGDDEIDNVTNTGRAYPRLDLERLLGAVRALEGGAPSGGVTDPGAGASGAPRPQVAAAGVHEVTLVSGGTIDGLDFGNQRLNRPPVVADVAAQSVPELGTLTLQLAVTDPDAGDTIVWSVVEGPAGAWVDADGRFTWTAPGLAPAQPLEVTVRATDAAGAFDEARFAIEVRPELLRVVSVEGTESGFSARFNRAFDVERLNLYASAGFPLGMPDVALVADGGTSLAGSILVDADQAGLRFLRTGGALGAGDYTATFAGRPDGLTDASGRPLDGDGNGVAGGNAAWTFTIAAPAAAPVLSIADFMRGPGQALAQPQVAAALPIRINAATAFTSVSFEVAYDPATLAVADVVAASGGTVTRDLGTPGLARITVTFGAPVLGTGQEVVRLIGSIPAAAPYGAARLVDVRNVLVDGAPGRGDDALQVVGYSGDANGDARYDAADLQRLQRVLGRFDAGFGEWRLIDPAVIGDVSGNARFDTADATILFREISGFDRPEIPAIPPPLAPSFAPSALVVLGAEAAVQVVPVAAMSAAAPLELRPPAAPASESAVALSAPQAWATALASSPVARGWDPVDLLSGALREPQSAQSVVLPKAPTAAGDEAARKSPRTATPMPKLAFDWEARQSRLKAALEKRTPAWHGEFVNASGEGTPAGRPNDRLRVSLSRA